jgi:hypothetical protein
MCCCSVGADGADAPAGGLAALLAEKEAELENLQAALGELSYEVGISTSSTHRASGRRVVWAEHGQACQVKLEP